MENLHEYIDSYSSRDRVMVAVMNLEPIGNLPLRLPIQRRCFKNKWTVLLLLHLVYCRLKVCIPTL